jgi:hypothetical protein
MFDFSGEWQGRRFSQVASLPFHFFFFPLFQFAFDG